MEKVLNRFGDFLDIRTGKQEFVEKKKKKKEQVWDEGQIAENKSLAIFSQAPVFRW